MKLYKNKICNDDFVVAEMVQALDGDNFEILAELFRSRLRNASSASVDPAWDRVKVILVEKLQGACSLRDLRPIAIISFF